MGKTDATSKTAGAKRSRQIHEAVTESSEEEETDVLSQEGLVITVGDQASVRWAEPSEDGKFHYYEARVIRIHSKSSECTVRWLDPMGYDPQIRVPSKHVRLEKQRRKKKPSKKSTTVGYARDDWRRQIEMQRLFLPHQSSSGRTVKHVHLFTFKEQATPSKQPPLRPGSWVGECIREDCERQYYDCVELTGTGDRIRAGQCICLRPPARWRTGWDSSRLWVAAVKEMYEDEASNMVLGCVWFYRPRDCIQAELPPGTRLQDEVFLSEEEDDNTMFSVVGTCKVLGESDFFHTLEQVKDRVSEPSGGGNEQQEECTVLCRYRYDDDTKEFSFLKDTDSAIRLACAKLALKDLIFHHIKRFQTDWVAAVGRQKRSFTQKTWDGRACPRDSEDSVSSTSTMVRSSCSSADGAPAQLSPMPSSPIDTDLSESTEQESLLSGLDAARIDMGSGAQSLVPQKADDASVAGARKRKHSDGQPSVWDNVDRVEGGAQTPDLKHDVSERGSSSPGGELHSFLNQGDRVRCKDEKDLFRDAIVREVLDGEFCVVSWCVAATSPKWSAISALVRSDHVFPQRDVGEMPGAFPPQQDKETSVAITDVRMAGTVGCPQMSRKEHQEQQSGGDHASLNKSDQRSRSSATRKCTKAKGLPETHDSHPGGKAAVTDTARPVDGKSSALKQATREADPDEEIPDCESDEVSFSVREEHVLPQKRRAKPKAGGRAAQRMKDSCDIVQDVAVAPSTLADPQPLPDIDEELIALPHDLQLLPVTAGGQGDQSLYAEELDSTYHCSQVVTSTGIVSERRDRPWLFGPYVQSSTSTAGVCKIEKRRLVVSEYSEGAERAFQTLAQYLKRNPDLTSCQGRLVGVKSNNAGANGKIEGFLTVDKSVEDGELTVEVQTANFGALSLTLFCAHNLVLPEDPLDEIVLLDRCEQDGAGAAQRDKAQKPLRCKDLPKIGFEWYPKLSAADCRKRAGHQQLYVCSAPMCGQAFADMSFCKAHQLACRHGCWDGDTPAPKNGRICMQVVNCTISGRIHFHNPTVEKKMRKFVVQRTSSEEDKISDDLPLPCKVLHTGDRGKGWGLFAARRIAKGEFIGHYAGTVVDVGYSKRYTGHYTFGLIHGLAIDGTGGGALRFMNHATQDQEPSVEALIVNHYGVCHVAVYARRDIANGEEMTLRYTDASDAEFFATACGLD